MFKCLSAYGDHLITIASAPADAHVVTTLPQWHYLLPNHVSLDRLPSDQCSSGSRQYREAYLIEELCFEHYRNMERSRSSRGSLCVIRRSYTDKMGTDRSRIPRLSSRL